ncbi:hypothetical protein SP15_278 [Bacillus phage SP-15]|uniref:Uncharacterized protein n=1 Tax=Bacillus phage SP-15 TaxID=1792032 RepID=A0A127AWJ3_9CAUD|nr:hypothetical protein SP15_278 [Bacillus phage SP-15]AMM45086.1 hypothetical protein SP15_278 [Bacillus phage SP-15]
MGTKELTTLKCEVVNYVQDKGYVVLLLHEDIEGKSRSWLALDANTHRAYEVESALEGYKLINSDFTESATPLKSSFILESPGILGTFEVAGSEESDEEFRSKHGIENLDYLSKITAEISDKYPGNYRDLAVKVANTILADTDGSGDVHQFQGDTGMTTGEIAKWVLIYVLKDTYMMTPEVVLDLQDKFIAIMYNGHCVIDSKHQIAKYLPYAVSDEVDLIPILKPETIDVLFERPVPELTDDDQLVEFAIKVAMDFVSTLDSLDDKYATDLVNYKDFQHYMDFLKLHGATFDKVDMSDFENLLKNVKITETHLEFFSPKPVDTEGILESDVSRVSVDEFTVRTSSKGESVIKLHFNENAPVNEAMNILKATYSALVNS